MKIFKIVNIMALHKEQVDFSNCLMKLDNARRHTKMLECENVRRDNSNSGVTGFWGGVLLGMRENLACN